MAFATPRKGSGFSIFTRLLIWHPDDDRSIVPSRLRQHGGHCSLDTSSFHELMRVTIRPRNKISMPLSRLFAQMSVRAFLISTLLSLLVLCVVIVVPQWLSKQARFEVLRTHVAEVAQLAAAVVDGDLQHQLSDPANYSDELYQSALIPLVRLHSAAPSIFYVYTMTERDGIAYFVLDTAESPALKTHHRLQASPYMEPFKIYDEYADDWLDQLRAGKTYVGSRYQYDNYGFFLSGHTPIYDSQGHYSGFVGVDFDLNYFVAREAHFRWIGIGSFATAILLALLIGTLVGRHYNDIERRIDFHLNESQRDELTSLLNRRGALQEVQRWLVQEGAAHSLMLIDIDDFKYINDNYGHATGDRVLIGVADVIRQSVRDSDIVARLGGDEFLIFAPYSDRTIASNIAARIIEGVHSYNENVACSPFSVSIGICNAGENLTEFEAFYGWADEALYRAKSEGKNRYAFFE
jgi:diguanylate cyclase (GGDEF)-like protein